jgi:hypothetical protein
MSETLQGYCHAYHIEWTRSHAYHKNDQAWVEQKNGAVVRRLTGYGRLSGLAAAGILQRLYERARLYVNFFQPSFKLASKQHSGAQVQSTIIHCSRRTSGSWLPMRSRRAGAAFACASNLRLSIRWY